MAGHEVRGSCVNSSAEAAWCMRLHWFHDLQGAPHARSRCRRRAPQDEGEPSPRFAAPPLLLHDHLPRAAMQAYSEMGQMGAMKGGYDNELAHDPKMKVGYI